MLTAVRSTWGPMGMRTQRRAQAPVTRKPTASAPWLAPVGTSWAPRSPLPDRSTTPRSGGTGHPRRSEGSSVRGLPGGLPRHPARLTGAGPSLSASPSSAASRRRADHLGRHRGLYLRRCGPPGQRGVRGLRVVGLVGVRKSEVGAAAGRWIRPCPRLVDRSPVGASLLPFQNGNGHPLRLGNERVAGHSPDP